jgi:hypothetical protein
VTDRSTPYTPPDPRWLAGTEYGGVQPTLAGGIQPKDPEHLTAGEILRLSYVTGDLTETRADLGIEDRRQMMGLRPAEGGRPQFIDGLGDDDDPRLTSELRREGYGK